PVRNPKIVANIRYTTDDEFLIFRGIVVKNNGFSQMTGLCQTLINHNKYCGASFSYGDQYIYDCANGQQTGNAESWVTVGVNHHLTLTIKNLSSLHAALAAY
ncbi:hypothetical protein P4S93_18500, partial [Aneurinibacillus thermoaerophilus]|uniref:beta family protein n=1 Tax=Aneurinibacillus thermoaerophilus TaxID=143495 RepID=UPI002E22CACE|nr:hypothetical protein [Aneurinibacillus thermoaerophilus]